VTETDALLALDRRHLWHPFTQAGTAPPPIPVASAQGCRLTAADGREYLDLISSWWVTLHGHAEPAIAAAIARQATTLEQVIFAGFTHAPAIELARRLAAILPTGLERVFFSDDGSTSVEVALKLAWQYWRNRGEERRRRFLCFEGGYHGDTVGAMSAGASSGFYQPFRELLFQVDPLPFPATWDGDPDVEAKEAAGLAALDGWLERHRDEAVAMILEPLVQGAAGMRMCRPAFLATLAARLSAAGVLLIADEVMTGFGRTGALFASAKAGIAPDIVCLSKGLTGGFLPLAATVCRPAIYEAFLGADFGRAFAHGHSFTANPLGCAAALASLDLLQAPGTTGRLAAIEALHRARTARLGAVPGLTRPRVCGTIAAVDFAGAGGYTAALGPRLAGFFLARGLLLRPLGRVVYLLPPYCVGDDDLNRAYDAVEEAAATIAREGT
jgi:adenosylmethionine-8-amino-7-oxononanoate aminotransferase